MTMQTSPSYGLQIRQQRLARMWTLEYMAELMGVHPDTIRSWEKNRRRLRHASQVLLKKIFEQYKPLVLEATSVQVIVVEGKERRTIYLSHDSSSLIQQLLTEGALPS